MQQVGPSPYAPQQQCANPARIMPDGGAVRMTSAATNGPRHFKRRRVDGTLDDADPADTTDVVNSGEAYVLPHSQRHQLPQWNPDAHASHSYPRTASNASATAPAVAADSNSAAAAATTTSEGGSAWQASSYPDLASYQQQPYFYSTTDSTTTYNSSWPPPSEPVQQSYGDSAASTNYPVDDQPNVPSSMPFFPVSQPAAVAGSNNDVDTTVSTFSNGFVNANDAGHFEFNRQDNIGQGQPSSDLVPKPPSSSFYFDEPSTSLKIQSLPILDNLATQLIHTLSKASYPQIQELMRAPDSEDSQAYRTRKSLFDQTRKVYSRETPFIDAIAIQMFQPNQQEIIRKANIATFVSSILGAHDVGFFHMNEFFMETFVPLGHRLLKWQGGVFLELKTQIYISALMNSDGSPEDMLDELFPPDLDSQILTRHPDAPSLSPSEQDFIDRSRQRKSYLLKEPTSRDAMKELQKKYQWSDFVREFASCISKNVDGIVNVPVRSQNTGGNSGGKSGGSGQGMNDLPTLMIGGTAIGSGGNGIDAISSLNSNGKSSSSRDTPNGGDSSNASRKPGSTASTIRQPWTKPEEDALLAGLERVSGPHWSQILALYGRGGSVSEVLKDRNQVQLKDKARNLKLFYLKTGKEVPASLQGVTGELRKRGGARARAALGLTDAEDAAQGSVSTRGENIDPSLDGQRPTKKKAGKR